MEPKLTMTLGAAIKLIRETEGQSAEVMAEYLQITPRLLKAIESGRRQPPGGLLAEVVNLYGWDPSVLWAMSILHRCEHGPGRLSFTLTQHRMLLDIDPS